MLAIKIAEVKYLPLTESKRVSHHFDVPYGSHYDNIPFQVKRGPALAIVGAIGTISTGAAIGGFLGGVLIAGGIASGLGALTGNKFLSTLGMGLSLAGGIGAAFTDGAGNFLNPFAEGNSFSDTALGKGFGKMSDGLKNFFGDIGAPSDAVNQLGITGEQTVSAMTDNIPKITESSFISDAVSGAGGGINLSNSSLAASPAAKGGGLFGSLMNSQTALGLMSGISDGYNNYQQLKQQQPLIDSTVDLRNAQTDQIQFGTDLARTRYDNMQSQDVNLPSINPNAQPYTKNPLESQGRIALAINGEVKYVTPEEFAALQAQNQQGGGLIQQGGMA